MPFQSQHSALRSLTLKQRARFMRHSPTASEHRLWLMLSGRKLGWQFRRQVVIGSSIVDFLAPKAKLIVEVDGGYHEARVSLDAARQRKLEALGYRVLRVSHEAVMTELRSVVELVWSALQA